MRAAFLALAALCAPALASEPGQPLDCSDWVFNDPSLSCAIFGDGVGLYGGGSSTVVDHTGREVFMRMRNTGPAIQCNGVGDVELMRRELIAHDANGWTVLAYVDERCGALPGLVDSLDWNCGLLFNGVAGELIFNMGGSCRDSFTADDVTCWDPPHRGSGARAIRGFTTILDLFDSFTPAGVGITVPVRPEGLRGSETFDTYMGEVTRPLNLSHAQPLRCAYPAQPPQPGDWLTIPDPPRPAPGHATYVLTAVTYGGERRAGRKTGASGRLVGRDASVLPQCAHDAELSVK